VGTVPIVLLLSACGAFEPLPAIGADAYLLPEAIVAPISGAKVWTEPALPEDHLGSLSKYPALPQAAHPGLKETDTAWTAKNDLHQLHFRVAPEGITFRGANWRA
jgi:hypothetical protein